MTDVLLDIRDLRVAYRVYGGELKVLNGVNFRVAFAEKRCYASYRERRAFLTVRS
jgi:ABC-type glutathione transport system ATPase component